MIEGKYCEENDESQQQAQEKHNDNIEEMKVFEEVEEEEKTRLVFDKCCVLNA